ncbi:hypothetical protein C3F09_11685 [candidate division GN15 bacterium]|uniref:DUF4878 domain-containing protein n=1 Tax=candidate division GN15 bacterium TaxID=2072418 RepID=A0A855X076_9BACT|nr:MAG: hypothetical protein C3F09_11685 [candidate division GN15 bacterium]
MKARAVGVWVALGLVGLMSGCSSDNQSDPRQVVISFFGAMERNDQAALAHLLDLASLMKNTTSDYAVSTDQPRVFTNPQEILNDLTNDGLTKTRWFSMQRIINNASVIGETATVEVTFVDKQNSIGYRTNFGLRKLNGQWRIYSFKTLQ